MKKTLRPYQQEAEQSIIDSWNRKEGEIPYVSVMTGLGKSLILASITEKALLKGKRILQLVPRKELVEQNFEEAFNYVTDKSALGICCGQLGKHQINRQAVIAMASSFLSRRATSGAFDILLIDECHRVKIDGLEDKISTYNKIIKSLLRINPKMLIAGATGTPYRLDQGELHESSVKGKPLFTHKVYDTSIDPGIHSLIEAGYLSHIETLNANVKVDLTGVRLSGGDYNKDDAGVKFDAIIDNAVEDMRNHFNLHSINTALIFASNLTNARHIMDRWNDTNSMRIVHGGMTRQERESAVNWIKTGQGNRYIVNVDILAEGFDMRHLQCCVLMRATKSPGLLVQMAGRIIRPHDDKEHGFLLDYGTNCERLGNIDNIIVPKNKKRSGDMPKKICMIPTCGFPNLLSAKKCKQCDAEFISLDDSGNYSMRTKEQALQAKRDAETITYEVSKVTFEKSYSSKDQMPMIKIRFHDNSTQLHHHFLCLDHTGFAKYQATKILMSMMKNPADYPLLTMADGGVCVENMMLLLENEEMYDKYFKRFSSITLAPNGRFKEMKSCQFLTH